MGWTSTTGTTEAGEDNADPIERDAIETGALVEAVASVEAADVVDEVEETVRAAGAGTEGFVGVFLSASFSSVARDVFGAAGVSTGCVCSEQLGTGARGFGTMAERSFECGASTPC